jgi:hypothetical protein
MTGQADRWIRWTTTGCVGLLALIAATVSYLHMHVLVEPGWVAALTPFSVDGMIVAASTTLLADSRYGRPGGFLPWALLAVGSTASLAANVGVAAPTATGRVIAAWPSFALIAAYEMLMRRIRRNAASAGPALQRSELPQDRPAFSGEACPAGGISAGHRVISRDLQRRAWQWAQANRAAGGSLPSGNAIARQFGRRERWGRLVKRSGFSGDFVVHSDSGELDLSSVEQCPPSTCKPRTSFGRLRQ